MSRQSILENEVIVYQDAVQVKRGWVAVIMASALTIGTFVALPFADRLSVLPAPEYEVRPVTIQRQPLPPEPVVHRTVPASPAPSPEPVIQNPMALPELPAPTPSPEPMPDLQISLDIKLAPPDVQATAYFPLQPSTKIPSPPPAVIEVKPTAPGLPTESTSGQTSRPTGILEADAVDQLPVVMEKVAPTYPSRARWNNQEGYVDLLFVVTADGHVEQLRVLDSQPAKVFDKAAMESLTKWRFTPGMKSGFPVSTRLKLRIRFALD